MRLKSFRIEKYRSIIDTGEIELSERDNITILAGQNESGKSSILRAIYDFERDKFEEDSATFSLEENPQQKISCTYKVLPDDNFCDLLSEELIEDYKLTLSEGEVLLDKKKINEIETFTIFKKKVGDAIEVSIDEKTLTLLKAAILTRDVTVPTATTEDPAAEPKIEKEKLLIIPEDDHGKIAETFWGLAPKILLFDDFCDLLPDKILISDLSNKNEKAAGYRAVRNLEAILKTDFVKKNGEEDAVRRTKEEQQNQKISIDFQKDWGQRIHDENQVLVKYTFEKRVGDGEAGSYVNFYVQTKEGQPLRPKQRSKGLIWFLSLWLELKSQESRIILLLDEPDQHLHIKAQKDVLGLINKLANNGDQICLATHSPYLIEVDYLNRVKLVINTKNDGTKIEDIATSKIDAQNKKDALQPIADAIGFHVSELSPLGGRNVLLEGVSDFYYFTAMKELLSKTGDYRFVPGVGVRKINSLISLAIGYGLEWVGIIDDDPTVGGQDSLNKFTEVKEYVFDRDEAKTREKIYILPNIVGVENMFSFDDLKLVDEQIQNNADLSKSVGKDRKILFAKIFLEKMREKEITLDKLSDTSKENFGKAFDFIEAHLGNVK